jgi:hypothetical protein
LRSRAPELLGRAWAGPKGLRQPLRVCGRRAYAHAISVVQVHPRQCCTGTPTPVLYRYTHASVVQVHPRQCCTGTPTPVLYRYTHASVVQVLPRQCCTGTPTPVLYRYTHASVVQVLPRRTARVCLRRLYLPPCRPRAMRRLRSRTRRTRTWCEPALRLAGVASRGGMQPRRCRRTGGMLLRAVSTRCRSAR